jgi:hypothetical protein
MDFSGWIPSEGWAILIMGALIASWVIWQIGSFLLSHVTIAWGVEGQCDGCARWRRDLTPHCGKWLCVRCAHGEIAKDKPK